MKVPGWEDLKNTRRRDEHEVTYEIIWLVPADRAIGSKAYWTPVVLPHGKTWTPLKVAAERWFRRATAVPRRLVAVERRVMEVSDV